MIMSVAAACLLAGCGNPVAPLQAGQAVEPGVVQASVAETPDQCREVTFTITGPETVVGQWPDSTCHEGLKVIAGAPMEWQEEGGRRLRMIVRYVNLTGVAVGLPLDVMLPVGSKFPLDPPTAAHSTMVPLEFDSLGINGRTWWILSGPAGVLGVGDTSRVDTLLFQIKEPVLSARFRFNHYPVEATVTGAVPMQAPDGRPSWFNDDSTSAGGFFKRALLLVFLPTATQAQRDAAVQSVQGQVVGGLPAIAGFDGGEGTYYIRVPSATTIDTLVALKDFLLTQPGVAHANILVVAAPTVRRPTESAPGWGVDDWALSPDSSSGNNWPFEEIAAPLAWSCSTGSPQTKVSVVDKWFRSSADYAPNVIGAVPGSTPDPVPHGTYMATLLAARGNNGQGAAGVAWTVGLAPEATGQKASQGEAAQALKRAIAGGARVVSMSLGSDYVPSQSARQDTASANAWHNEIARVLGPAAQRPLLIVSAGNHSRNAFFSGLPSLADPNHIQGIFYLDDVLVVGASAPRAGTTWDRWGGPTAVVGAPGSNTGPLVDVYAPGQGVPIWDDSLSQFVQWDGTSLATPLVAGIAALLVSFDPTLSNAEIKNLILQGAANGGRPIQNGGGKFLANAWESLKLASDRPGTPLCGKTVRTVWNGNKYVVVIDRTATVKDTLVPSEAFRNWRMVSVAQGGRKLATVGSMENPQFTDVFTLSSSGSWGQTTEPGAFMIQYLEQDTAYFHADFTDPQRDDLYVRIGSAVTGREVGEVHLTAAMPRSIWQSTWDWEWPAVSPTGDWVLFSGTHITTCDEVYTIYAVPLRGGGSTQEALRSVIDWCSSDDYPVGFTWSGPMAWRADGRAFVSPRLAMPSDPSGPSDMSIRQFSVTGTGTSPSGTPVTVPARGPLGVFWESDGARIRIAEGKATGCEVIVRAAASPGTVLGVLGPCDFFPYVGASLRAGEGPATTSGRPGRRMPGAARQTSVRGIPFDPR